MIQHVKIQSFHDLVTFAESSETTRRLSYIYRGIGNYAYSLQSSIEWRTSEQEDWQRTLIQKTTLSQFIRNARAFDPTIVSNWSDPIEVMAAMQHYGGITRLVDFSYSPFIALYFACNDPAGVPSPIIWGLNTNVLKKRLAEIEGANPDRHTELEAHLKYYQDYIFPAENQIKRSSPWFSDYFYKQFLLSTAIHKKPFPIDAAIVHLEPFLRNKRIQMQQGCFALNLRNDLSFIDCLAQMFDSQLSLEPEKKPKIADLPPLTELSQNALEDTVLLAAHIDPQSLKKITYLLGSCNLRTVSLFPDIPGILSSLQNHIPRRYPQGG